MSILALGRKHQKKRKFPNQEREKTQNRKKIPNERVGESKKKKEEEERKILDQGSEKNRRNMKKGLRTRQYLNNTELSPSKQKRKETTTQSGPLPLIANQNPVR